MAARFSRFCRAIDDVLLIDLSVQEQRFLLSHTYPVELELKQVCVSPEPTDPVDLDLEIRHDRGGFYTVLYDKRDALHTQGKMGVVRRFPHIQSVLASQCKYGCLVSFLHRALRNNTRRKAFRRDAARRMAEMYADGYSLHELLRLTRRFVLTFVAEHHQRRQTVAEIRDRALRLTPAIDAASRKLRPVRLL